MELNDYVLNEEEVIAEVRAFDEKLAVQDERKGSLAVTPNRVVFANNKGVYDISLNRVDVIEYEDPEFDIGYLMFGVMLPIASYLFKYQFEVPSPISDFENFIAILLFAAGPLIVFYGYLRARSRLTLHTSNKSFEFVSSDDSIQNVAHALRAQEIR